MPFIRRLIGIGALWFESASLHGCAGQMPSMSPFFESPGKGVWSHSVTAQTPRSKEIEPARLGYSRSVEDMRFQLASGHLSGDRWKFGGQASLPLGVTVLGGYVRGPVGITAWGGSSLTGVSGGSAVFQRLDPASWFTIGVYEYLARNEMVMLEYSGPSPLGGPGGDWPAGSRGYLESGLGSLLTLRIPNTSEAFSLEGRYGWDHTNGFRRARLTATYHNSI